MLHRMPFTLAILATILSYVWYFDPLVPNVSVAVPIVIVAALATWHCLRTGEWGFERRGLVPGLRAVALVLGPAVVLTLIAGASLGTVHDRRDFLGSLGALVVWGGAQQWVLQTVVLREAQRATSERWGILVAATLFAVVHLPNPFLTPVTFAAGLVWCAIYARHPNIVPMAIAHGLGTLAILYAFDDAITGRLRIGYSYLLLGVR
jgi:membrane protease YdiL (CAAX protease family)